MSQSMNEQILGNVLCAYGMGGYQSFVNNPGTDTSYNPVESMDSLTALRESESEHFYVSLLYKAFQSINYNKKIDLLFEEVRGLKQSGANTIKLNMLETRRLKSPMDVIVEPDDDGFIARTVDFPLFGYGDDRIEAIETLKSEIESLYEDLMEDDNFTEEWKGIKDYLKEQVV